MYTVAFTISFFSLSLEFAFPQHLIIKQVYFQLRQDVLCILKFRLLSTRIALADRFNPTIPIQLYLSVHVLHYCAEGCRSRYMTAMSPFLGFQIIYILLRLTEATPYMGHTYICHRVKNKISHLSCGYEIRHFIDRFPPIL